MTTVASLNEGVITPTNNRIKDGALQIGNRPMRSISNFGMPDVITAISRSADGYYYRLGLKLGVERFEKWVRSFHFGERTGIDLPNERRGIIPTRATKERSRMGKWGDYDMAASAFGQGQNALTPIQLLRYVGILAMKGHARTPHLLLRAAPGIDREGNSFGQLLYQDKNSFVVPMSEETAAIVKRGMWEAVNGGGTVRVILSTDAQPLLSVTVTAYVPAKRS